MMVISHNKSAFEIHYLQNRICKALASNFVLQPYT